MAIIKTTKNKECLVDDDIFDKLNKYHWYYCERDYLSSYVYGNVKGKLVSIHRFIMKARGKMQVHHINGNTLDNRKQNLQIMSQSDNCKIRLNKWNIA